MVDQFPPWWIKSSGLQQRANRYRVRPERLGVRRQRIAIIRELQRVESQHRCRGSLMAIATIFDAGDGMTLSPSNLDNISSAASRDKQRICLLVVPAVRRENPIVFAG